MRNFRLLPTLLQTAFVLLLAPTGAEAKSVRELWLNLPDSVAPYLSGSQRLECVDFYEMHSTAETTNLLGGRTRIDTMAVDFMQVRLSKASSLQMKLLPAADGKDSVLCVVHTFFGPEKESSVELFTQDWRPMGRVDISVDAASCFARPDSMSSARFNELLACPDPVMFSAELAADSNTLTVKPNYSVASESDRKELDAMALQKKLNWNGATFK